MNLKYSVAFGYVVATIFAVSLALPVLDVSSGIDNETIEELKASLNDSPKNL